MVYQRRKKKTDRKESPPAPTSQDVNKIEPPKNLLPEKAEPDTEPKQELAGALKEEGEKTSKPAGDLASVEVKTKEAESELVTPASVSPPPSPPSPPSSPPSLSSAPPLPSSPPPPISVPLSHVDSSGLGQQPSKRKLLLLPVFVLLILIVFLGVWMYLSNTSKKEEKLVESVAPTQATLQPTVIATEEAKLDKYPIKVLNGSGIAGEASKLQEVLEEGGFEVSEVGNAESYDYTDTIIQAKKEVEKTFLAKLRNLITKNYTLGKDELLSATDSSDVIVIVGSKKAEE